jgi:3-oxoacyl-[acyl-carrier protein] reductase
MNRIDLSGRTAVVTGAASGLGLAVARRLLQSGAAVALWDRDAGALDAATSEVDSEGEVSSQVIDVTDHAAVAEGMRVAADRLGRLDILVTSAGTPGESAAAAEYSIDGWHATLAVNLSGTFYCCRAAIPFMMEHGYGRIVTVASGAAKEGNPHQIGYVAAKAGVVGLTKSLGKELARTGIVANCVTPAMFDTPMLQDYLARTDAEVHERIFSSIPMGRIGRPDELAAMVAWLASEECSFSTGATFDLSGGRATY